ncbi:MAG: uridine diphosphate-N-acetylglucosamine-binding protein YvcK [Anaerolineales bacterium]|nr:uridine diphosphate-N-acetylglucosamine-binding protein YvcK [Anaerolineales bacterium]
MPDVTNLNWRSAPGGRKDGFWEALRHWLVPGIGVKRWLGVMILGTALIGLGVAIILLDIYRAYPESNLLPVFSLMALPRWLRALAFGAAGLTLLLLGMIRLNRALLAPYMRPGRPVARAVAEHRRLGRGPKIVAIGGGNGLATLLRGLKEHTGNLTAIVSVADDGGSSGRLRRSLGIPPPGDLRNCLAALSDDEDLLTQLFRYRFAQEDELDGHAFGNLFIAALTGVTGSFDEGLLEAAHILGIRGQVLPATLADVALVADKTPMMDAQAIRIQGESRIPDMPGRVRAVHLEPNDPPAYPGSIKAVLAADMIVLGPGSLYTSVLPNLLVPDLAKAVRASRGLKVQVCNIANQLGETDGYDAAAHLAALEDQLGRGLIEMLLVNDRLDVPAPEAVHYVPPPATALGSASVFASDLVDPQRPWRHDPAKLAAALIQILEERTGPLESAMPIGEAVHPGLN